MSFTHVFISRPRRESEELAAMLNTIGLQTVVQPAFSYFPVDARAAQKEMFDEIDMAGSGSLVVFTSPRSVAHGLAQLPDSVRFNARIAAIGPATAKALGDAGIRVSVIPKNGYTSEALLKTLAEEGSSAVAGHPFAFIIAAAGGRKKLFEGLGKQGWQPRLVIAYRSEPAVLDKQSLGRLGEASGVLSVWTSANAMKALSQRLPPATWFQICRYDWLVISDRLKRLARAYGPPEIHLAAGPGNRELFLAIRNLS
ncbi:MAG: uroporphyrinogen-III synthase [Xanthomonadales bacterium]|nr:uroporphyrinogen-III synthase [Gammaproteobacteria bacterium]MBT8054836.1 uroporphyrinogen-III synthase [Gammaproteobacteria bacterium]NND58517.1 uroporphyrinogen-III synthase [Xanthomonadales bacterium]NNK51101.1 uroporphyrinogen-III synthase [Xanthomonadales bacterium]